MSDAAAAANKALDDLQNAVEPLGKGSGDSFADASAAHADGVKHDGHADEAFKGAMASRDAAAGHFAAGRDAEAHAARGEAEAQEVVGHRHADLADSYHDLASHHMGSAPGMKKAEGGDDKGANPWLPLAKEMGDYHTSRVEACNKTADHYTVHASTLAAYPDMVSKANDCATAFKGRAAKRAAFAESCANLGKDEGMAMSDVGTMTAGFAKLDIDADGFDKASGDFFGKRAFSPEERSTLAASGAALKDGSFPIANAHDLRNAVTAMGRAPEGKRPQVKAHIIERAKVLDAQKELPAEWTKTDMPEVAHGPGGPTALAALTNMVTLATSGRLDAFPNLVKGLGIFGTLTNHLQGMQGLLKSTLLESMVEADAKDDMPAKLRKHMEDGVVLLKDYVANGVAALLTSNELDVTALNGPMPSVTVVVPWQKSMADTLRGTVNDTMTPAISKARKELAEKLDAAGDFFAKAEGTKAADVEAKLAKADAADAKLVEATETLAKAEALRTAPDPALKDKLEKAEASVASLTSERDAAQDAVTTLSKRVIPLVAAAQMQRKKLEATEASLTGITERLAKLEAQPVPARGKGTPMPVSRTGATPTGSPAVRLEVLSKVDDVAPGHERAEALVQAAHELNHNEKFGVRR